MKRVIEKRPNEERIRAIIAEHMLTDEADVTLSSRLEEDLEADSLDVVELAMLIEDEFDTEIGDEVMGKWKTVEDILNSVK